MPSKFSPPIQSNSRAKWAIGQFYRQAWSLIKNQPRLLILGVAAAIFASSGFSRINQFDSSSIRDIENQKTVAPAPDYGSSLQGLTEEEFKDQVDLEPINQGLDEAAPYSPFTGFAGLSNFFSTQIKPGLSAVPDVAWSLLVLEITVLTLGGFIIGLATSAWAQGVLVKGVALAKVAQAKKQSVSLAVATRQAWGRVKSIIWFNIAPILVGILVLIVSAIAAVIVFAVVNAMFSESQLLSIINLSLGIGILVAAVYFLVRYLAAIALGLRYVVLTDLGGWHSFKQGFKLAKGNLRKMIRLGAVNLMVSTSASVIIAGIFVTPVVVLVLMWASKYNLADFNLLSPDFSMLMSPLLLTSLGLILLMFGALSMLTVVVRTFIFAVWHYAFEVLIAKE